MRIFSVLVLLFSPIVVFAQSILINEIAWMGTPVAGVEENQWWRYEWFELYNAGDTVGMLDGWTVELSREKIDFKIPLSGTISADGYFLVGASDKIPNLDLNYKNLGGKFFNGGQRVVLKNNVGEIVDEIDTIKGLSADEAGWPAGDNKTKQTMERIQGSEPCIQGSEPCMDWQTSMNPGGTPKSPNSEGVIATETKPSRLLNFDSSGHKEIAKLNLIQGKAKLNFVKDETEKDSLRSFQSRVPLVNPITLLAGFLALGFSGVLLLVKRSLASRQARLPGRQERQKS